jgi:hypothetical protein
MIFIVLMHSSDNFIGLVDMTFPGDVHFLSDGIQYNQHKQVGIKRTEIRNGEY